MAGCLLQAAFSHADTAAQLPSVDAGSSKKEKVIIDTDIGIDVDDAFAVALALSSPELDILGFSTASGDTVARAKIIDRILGEAGRQDIPVTVGVPTMAPNKSLPAGLIGLQRRYGEGGRYAQKSHRDAVEFIFEQIHRYPGEVTLVTVGPLSNVGRLIDKDIGSFRKLKRVVMMGGWIDPRNVRNGQAKEVSPEYNVSIDIGSAHKLFESGVPIYVMPLDSTNHLAFDESRRKTLFAQGTPLTDAIALLYLMWDGTTPILYDPMAVAFAVDPQLCPVEPMNILVDAKGITRVGAATPNAQVCLRSDANVFVDYFMRRLSAFQDAE